MRWRQFECKSGSVVQLQSGGFAMTVAAVVDGFADCVWADKGRIRRDRFPVELLKRSTEGRDFTLIIEGLNATSDEIAEFKKVSDNA